MRGKRVKGSLLPYVVFMIRILLALFAMAVAVLFFLELIKTENERFAYALCYLIPVIAAVIVGGDLYLRWKLDIRPLRETKKDKLS